MMEISELEKAIVINIKSYVKLLKNSFNSEDSKIPLILNLKNDIYILSKCFNDKLKITKRNPEKFTYDFSIDKSICDPLSAINKMLHQERKSNKEVILLFGSAGSGKSSVLQKLFIEAIQSWRAGDPIPIFMNLAIDNDLKEFWKRLQEYFDWKDFGYEDLIKQPLLLFLDSLDESRMDLRAISNIFDSLLSYANFNSVKMMIACRTDYLEEESIENQLKENVKFRLRYIIPLDFFFFDNESNMKELIYLYLHQWEKRNSNEIQDLAAVYIQKISEFRLKKIMKTTSMIFMVLTIMPRLIKIDTSSGNHNINFLTIYELYLEQYLENGITRSTNEVIQKKSVAWFFKIGILLAESMIMTKRVTNQIRKKATFKFLLDPLLVEAGENYNQNQHLIENINIYDILRTLNLNIHVEKRPPHEEITLSFPDNNIKNYFLTKGFEQKLLSGDGFPEWVSQKLVVDDQNLVHFMVEAIKTESNSKFASIFENAIISSKHSEDPKVNIRAANLISFLVASNYSFYGKDLSDIKISGANISDGIFHACNFDRADLSNVTLNNIKMDRASFKNTNFKDAIFDTYPYFEGHSRSVSSVAFSPDGKKVLSRSYDETIRLWDIKSGKELKKYEGSNSFISSIAFSPDGKKVACGSDDQALRIWNVKGGKEIKKYEGHNGCVRSVDFSPDGKKVVSGSNDKTVRLWNVESGKELKKYEGHSSYVVSVAFSPDGKKVLSGSYDETIRLWDVESGEELKKYEGHSHTVFSVAFSSDGKKMVSGSGDKTVRIWNVASGKELKKYEDHNSPVFSAVFSPDGKMVMSRSGDYKVRVWDAESGKKIKKYEGPFLSVAFSPDGKKMVSGCDNKVKIWNLEGQKELKKHEGHDGCVTSVAFSPDGKRVVSGSDDKTVRLWNVENGKELQKYEGHNSTISSVAFSPDGKKMISGSNDKSVRLWDVESGKELKKFESHNSSVSSVAFSPDGKTVLSGTYDETIRLLDVESGIELKKYQGHSSSVSSVSFSPDARKMVSGSNDKTVRLWDVESGEELKKYEGHSGNVCSTAFSQDGMKIVSGSFDYTVRLWDVESGKELKKYTGHSDYARSVAFSPDGKKVVSGGADKTIRLWDAENGKELKKYDGHSSYIRSVAFSPDGKKVVSGSGDNTVRFWEVDENKSNILIISSSTTDFSCTNCRNFEKSLNCSSHFMSLFKQSIKE